MEALTMGGLVPASASEDSKVTGLITDAVEKTVPKLDEFITISITYDAAGRARWHEVQVTFREYQQLLISGELDERKVCAVELFTYNVQNEADDTVRLIYDFVLLYTEKNPWRFA